jgi:phosphoglycolate phosphatase-like HAD superfamily hydrolase
MRRVRTLVLWDIDHTLIAARGLSGEIYREVFHRITGRQARHVADMHGNTDRAIISETLTLHDITPTPELLNAFGDALAERFAARQSEIRTRGLELPGARAALGALADRADVIQSVLTGNMRQIAVSKLTAFDLHTFVDLEVGAYGFDHAQRPPLVRLARERVGRKYGETFDATTTVLVGDTPRDVEAGHRGGARVVAVATGSSDEAALRAAGAELVLSDLSDTGAVLRAVLQVSAA